MFPVVGGAVGRERERTAERLAAGGSASAVILSETS